MPAGPAGRRSGPALRRGGSRPMPNRPTGPDPEHGLLALLERLPGHASRLRRRSPVSRPLRNLRRRQTRIPRAGPRPERPPPVPLHRRGVRDGGRRSAPSKLPADGPRTLKRPAALLQAQECSGKPTFMRAAAKVGLKPLRVLLRKREAFWARRRPSGAAHRPGSSGRPGGLGRGPGEGRRGPGVCADSTQHAGSGVPPGHHPRSNDGYATTEHKINTVAADRNSPEIARPSGADH